MHYKRRMKDSNSMTLRLFWQEESGTGLVRPPTGTANIRNGASQVRT
jgi:hypothetical protein